MSSKLYIVLIILFVGLSSVTAQTVLKEKPSFEYYRQWYLGKDAGIPFGVSTFSSFGSGKNHLGWTAGMYGGYHFNGIFSLEAYIVTGKMKQTYRNEYRFFWVGDNGSLYFTKPSGNSWRYNSLKTSVKIQNYGLRTNINLLGFFDCTKGGRWSVMLSPMIGAIGTKSTVRTINTDEKIMKFHTQWHLAMGGNLGGTYKVSKHFSVGIYSGMTYVTGSSMDGVQRMAGRDNYIWESGVRLNYIFSRRPRIIKKIEHEIRVIEDDLFGRRGDRDKKVVEVVENEMDTPIEEDNNSSTSLPVYESVKVPQQVAATHIPAYYFPGNSTIITDSEIVKARQVAEFLKKNPQARINIIGYADGRKNKEANMQTMFQRAMAIEKQIIFNNIDPVRISTLVEEATTNQNAPSVVIRVVQ